MRRVRRRNGRAMDQRGAEIRGQVRVFQGRRLRSEAAAAAAPAAVVRRRRRERAEARGALGQRLVAVPYAAGKIPGASGLHSLATRLPRAPAGGHVRHVHAQRRRCPRGDRRSSGARTLERPADHRSVQLARGTRRHRSGRAPAPAARLRSLSRPPALDRRRGDAQGRTTSCREYRTDHPHEAPP